MTRLQIVSAILACGLGASAVAAERNQALYVMNDTEGSHLLAGDVLVANGEGQVALYRNNTFVTMLQDPQDVTANAAGQPLYITNAEGAIVRGALEGHQGDLFVSTDAPQIVHYKKESYREAHHGGGTGPLTLHGGNVMVQATTYSIFWGSYGTDIQSGMGAFFGGFSTSSDAQASTEYAGTTVGNVSGKTNVGATYTDTNPPSSALSTSSAVAEVCKITNNNPDANGVYFIFTSTGAGNVNYCAWHSWGSCSNGALVQVAYMPNIAGVAGCDPGAPYGTANGAAQSQGLAALANVTSHELSETITDPRGTGWFYGRGQENGDECAWAFNPSNPLRSFTNGSTWKLQGEWSNAAFASSSGFANTSGQLACKN